MADNVVTLANGIKLPVIGLGTWNSKPGDVKRAVISAIAESGYRHIDCAYAYDNQVEVGEGLSEVLSSGKVKREELFITSKCWNTFHSRPKVTELCKIILSDLRLDYLDLYLIHWPTGYQEGGLSFPIDKKGQLIYSDIHFIETWKGMEDVYRSGLTKAIGVSNFNEQQIEQLLANCEIKPMVNQIEMHPYLNQDKLLNYCKSKDITVIAYCPLGSPQRPVINSDDPNLLQDVKVKEIAAQHNKTPAQVLLRFGIQRGCVVIPKSVTPSRIKQNINVFDFQLDKCDMDYLMSLNCDWRACRVSEVSNHPLYPFKDVYIKK